MSDVHQSAVIGDSPEAVAYALFLGIAANEKKSAAAVGTPIVCADKKWALDTYAACLLAVRDPNAHLKGLHPSTP